jgi:hypothetical protein
MTSPNPISAPAANLRTRRCRRLCLTPRPPLERPPHRPQRAPLRPQRAPFHACNRPGRRGGSTIPSPGGTMARTPHGRPRRRMVKISRVGRLPDGRMI